MKMMFQVGLNGRVPVPSEKRFLIHVQLMGAKALWNHDAFFDYADRWMSQDDPYAAARGGLPRPAQEGKSQDAFVDAMWSAYRNKVPDQSGGKEPMKWIWNADRRTGKYVPNPKQD